MEDGTITSENILETTLKVKHISSVWSSYYPCDIYPREINAYIQTKTYSWLSIAVYNFK